MANKVYVGDVGTEIELDVGEDISTASLMQIKYKKPDGTEGSWDANLDGTNKINYIVQSGDLDQDGDWKLQAYVELISWQGHGETVILEVNKLFL